MKALQTSHACDMSARTTYTWSRIDLTLNSSFASIQKSSSLVLREVTFFLTFSSKFNLQHTHLLSFIVCRVQSCLIFQAIAYVFVCMCYISLSLSANKRLWACPFVLAKPPLARVAIFVCGRPQLTLPVQTNKTNSPRQRRRLPWIPKWSNNDQKKKAWAGGLWRNKQSAEIIPSTENKK